MCVLVFRHQILACPLATQLTWFAQLKPQSYLSVCYVILTHLLPLKRFWPKSPSDIVGDHELCV